MDSAPLEMLFGVLVILIIVSAFFSSSETAMMALNRYRLSHLRRTGHRGAKNASDLLERPDRLIGLILIGNNLVNILASSIATVIGIRLYGDAGIALGAFLLTLVILIFAEITPKTLAALYPERIAFPFSYILKPLMFIMMPAVWAINTITNGLLKLAKVDTQANDNNQLSPEELRTVVDEAGALIPERHQSMLLNILDLEEMTVNDLMIPRHEVYGIDLDESDNMILKKIRDSEHTRLPVYRGDINEIESVLHLRNSAQFISGNGLDRKALEALVKPPHFVPENTSLHKQLLNFQHEKRRIGVVIDEYGAVMGVVTLEDILEEIVGEFTQSFSISEEDIRELNGSYLVDGSMSIRDINKRLNWDLPVHGPKTLNGLIMEHLESFPDANVGIEIDNYHIEIVSISDNMIQKAKLNKRPKQLSFA